MIPAVSVVENCYVFKSRLQEYAQKAGLPTPEYQTLKEGPSHEPVFKSAVLVDGVTYDSLPGFFSRKAAEQSAAEVALMEIAKSLALPTSATIPAVQETGLCKNLLQEYAQKMNYAIPSYISHRQASGVAPFISTVEIGGIQYIGAAARTKKEAEIKAARTALLAIQGQSDGSANGASKYIVVPGKRKETEKKPIETPKPLKVKKGGFKKQRNKRKFNKKNGKAANVEKDENRVPGHACDSDVPMQPAIAIQDPSSDTVMLQPAEEARNVEHEPPSDAAMLQPDKDAGRGGHEPPSDTAMAQHNEESGVKQEPLSDTVMPQPDEEVRGVESPTDTSMVQPNEEARRVKQEPPIDTAVPLPNKEARTVKHASLSDSATVQPNAEATNVKEEPLRNPAMMEHNEGTASLEPLRNLTATVNQEPPSDASLLQPKKEPRVEGCESAYEHKDVTPEDALLEAN